MKINKGQKWKRKTNNIVYIVIKNLGNGKYTLKPEGYLGIKPKPRVTTKNSCAILTEMQLINNN